VKTLVVLVVLLFSASLTWAQHAGYNPPSVQSHVQVNRPSLPEFGVAMAQNGAPPPIPSLQSADLAKLKRDADELFSLAQSIPSNVDLTTKGILPKDLGERLKKIEKLSKQLRSQIYP